MGLADIIQSLGIKRIVWIDDAFNDTPDTLSKMLLSKIEITRLCGFVELEEQISGFEIDEQAAITNVAEVMAGLPKQRRDEIKAIFFEKEKSESHRLHHRLE